MNPRYLVPPQGKWTGTLGQPFEADDFETYVQGLGAPPAWVQFMVIHNTGAPTLKQWHDSPADRPAGLRRTEQRLANVTHGYRQQGWKGGPHLFIDERFIWTFTPLWLKGTHSPSFNSIAWGVEVVGDFDREEWSAQHRALVVAAFAILHEWRGLDPSSIKLHKDDPRTTHDCPGKGIASKKAEFIAEVRQAMLLDGDHVLTPPPDEAGTTPPERSKKHLVQPGDTYYGIAHRYGISVYELKALNSSNEILNPGEVLNLQPERTV